MPKGIPNAIAEQALGSKFFARIRSFDLACPRCDAVFKVSPTAVGRRGVGRLSNSCWDSRLSRFRCYYCGLILTLGVIAYSHERRGGRRSPPSDTIPSPRQALELRKDAVWALEKIGNQGRKIRVNRIAGDIPIIGDGVDPRDLPAGPPENAPELDPPPPPKPRGWNLKKPRE